MKILLVLASFFTVVFGGVGILSSTEEKDALDLWMKYCKDNAEESSDGSVLYYCKTALEETEESISHNIDVTPAPDPPRQVVFIQPPAINYKHNVAVNGESAKPQKTTIYVLPRKNTHSLDFVDNRPGTVPPEKPSLYFLKDNPNTNTPSSKGGYKRQTRF